MRQALIQVLKAGIACQTRLIHHLTQTPPLRLGAHRQGQPDIITLTGIVSVRRHGGMLIPLRAEKPLVHTRIDDAFR